MPSSTSDLRRKMVRRFGSIDSQGPEDFLVSRGFSLTRDWEWIMPPRYATLDEVPQEEWDCIVFLLEEWDYGGMAPADQPGVLLPIARLGARRIGREEPYKVYQTPQWVWPFVVICIAVGALALIWSF